MTNFVGALFSRSQPQTQQIQPNQQTSIQRHPAEDPSQGPITILNIPKDILKSIFLYLIPQRIQSLALVSKSWKELCREDNLWKQPLQHVQKLDFPINLDSTLPLATQTIIYHNSAKEIKNLRTLLRASDLGYTKELWIQSNSLSSFKLFENKENRYCITYFSDSKITDSKITNKTYFFVVYTFDKNVQMTKPEIFDDYLATKQFVAGLIEKGYKRHKVA